MKSARYTRHGRRTGRRFTAAVVGATAVAVVVSPAGAGEAFAARACFERSTEPYTSVVDSHLHFRPFGGRAFRDIAPGQNYFRLLGLKDVAPRVCPSRTRPHGGEEGVTPAGTGNHVAVLGDED